MLLGRDPERQAIQHLLKSARAGHSAVLALVGEPGIGKTALLEHATSEAGGLRLLRARGVESEVHLPFAGLYELLLPALHLVERLPAPRLRAIEGALALRPGTPAERFAVGAATLSLLALYAEESPLLVLVDDAHLLDASSAETIRFVLRRLLAEPIAALIAVREGEASLLDGADLPTLRVAGLDRESAAQLLGQVPNETVERLYRATGGNPLALTELAGDATQLAAAAFDAPIPVSAQVTRAFARRAEALAPSTQRLLVVAAADDTGDLVTLERAATHLQLHVADLAAAEQAGLVRASGGHLEFGHPLARAAIYAAAAPQVRREAHRVLARSLPDRDADRRAWHLAAAAAGTDVTASSALEEAGMRARLRSAYAIASAAFERSAQLAGADERRGRLFLAASEDAWIAGSAERAVALLEAARPLTADVQQGVLIDGLRGRIAMRGGPVMQGHAILSAAAERVAVAAPDLAVGLLADAIEAAFVAGDAAEMARTARRVMALVSSHASARTRFLAHSANGMALVFTPDGQRGIDSIRKAFALLEEHPDLRSDTTLLPWLLFGPLYLRESGSMHALADEALDLARSRAALGVLPSLLTRAAREHAASDDWARAEVEYDEAARIARETGQQTELAHALSGLAWLEARQGREADCTAHAREALAMCADLGVHLFEVWTIYALGGLELGLGRPHAALQDLEECMRRLDELGIEDPDLFPSAELVDAYLRTGRGADAQDAAARLETAARRKGQPWSLARAARCRGLLAGHDAFDDSFEEAVQLHNRTPDIFELGVTRLAFGARLRRARRRSLARGQLREAFDIFDRLGAAPWAEMTRVELLATGETARPRGTPALDALTRHELHIAQLLAGGKTTRETAAALFLSPKTIEYHLRSIYGKLGVSSRNELAAAIAPPPAAERAFAPAP